LNKRNEILSKINDKDSKIDCTMRDNLLDIGIRINKDERIDFFLTYDNARELLNKFNIIL